MPFLLALALVGAVFGGPAALAFECPLVSLSFVFWAVQI